MGKYFTHKKTKSGYLICVVPMCNTKKSTTTLKTFEFPSDLKRRTQWISAIVEATLENEEMSSLEDLYSLENRRMELEMEISNVLGDNSYVCARHFKPNDIVVHPRVCRLTANAVPSIFCNYSTNLPEQFFKKVCKTALNMVEVEDVKPELLVDTIHDAEFTNTENDKYIQEVATLCMSVLDGDDEEAEVIVPDPLDSEEFNYYLESNYPHSDDTHYEIIRKSSTQLVSTQKTNKKLKNKLRRKVRLLETRCRNMKHKITELEKKHELYNLSTLEKDAENNNEEAIFLLDMLRSYNTFEKTREEILTVNK